MCVEAEGNVGYPTAEILQVASMTCILASRLSERPTQTHVYADSRMTRMRLSASNKAVYTAWRHTGTELFNFVGKDIPEWGNSWTELFIFGIEPCYDTK
jgi:hypothetical protein